MDGPLTCALVLLATVLFVLWRGSRASPGLRAWARDRNVEPKPFESRRALRKRIEQETLYLSNRCARGALLSIPGVIGLSDGPGWVSLRLGWYANRRLVEQLAEPHMPEGVRLRIDEHSWS